jgi:hypothetical protein
MLFFLQHMDLLALLKSLQIGFLQGMIISVIELFEMFIIEEVFLVCLYDGE